MLKKPLLYFVFLFLSCLFLRPLYSSNSSSDSKTPSSSLYETSFTSPIKQKFNQKNETLSIQVGEAQKKKSLLVLLPFSCKKGENISLSLSKKIQNELFKTLSNNLDFSNLFQFLDQKKIKNLNQNLISPSSSSKSFPFQEWKEINMEFVIQSECEIPSPRQVHFKAYLHSISEQKSLIAKMYSSSHHFIRDLAHGFSNDVVFTLTKNPSFFETKILSSRWGGGNRNKEIFLMDWDGKNPKAITNHKSLSISPAWSWNGKQMAYTSFLFHIKSKVRNADLILYDLQTRTGRIISSMKGINSGAAFHPSGESLFFTSSIKGNPDIFQIFLKNNKFKQITHGPFKAMNVEPALSPDGKKMAFSSDRSGRPTIYIMDLSTKKTKRLISVGKYNASPAWSPDGQSLAFAGYDKGHFDIFFVKTDGTELIRLTSSKKSNGRWANNEDPSFSPDGKWILFTSDRSGNKQLYLIHPDGTKERRLTFDNYHYERPKWSPFLKSHED